MEEKRTIIMHDLCKEIYREYTDHKGRLVRQSSAILNNRTIAEANHLTKEIYIWSPRYKEAIEEFCNLYEDYSCPELIDPA